MTLRQSLVSGLGLLASLSSGAVLPRGGGAELAGYPNPNDQQLFNIEKAAGGLLPNGKITKLSAAAIANLQVIAINEQFEVAYFTSLINNITSGQHGYSPQSLSSPMSTGRMLETLNAILAQEALHDLGAVSFLKAFKSSFVPEPCTYAFPTTNIQESISLISTVTSLVLGTLQDVTQALAQNGDDGLARIIASIIGQEGEQNGFFRLVTDVLPAEKPFLTTSIGAYAWSALQSFLVKCPFDLNVIPLPIFPPLNVHTKVKQQDMTVTYSADLHKYGESFVKSLHKDKLWITYLGGQQVPISVPVSSFELKGTTVEVCAEFPWSKNILDGFIIAALTNSSNFAGPDDLPAGTLAAPGLIEVEHSDYW
ncbi:late sexual development protein [Microdochium trichocladiopsis]|uniref:Late sexual development protein n=1 Tax=Microdochium trichocladiopsis TaxID=1682393 RepID=A0A9P8XWM0_9PEZI|nr:late sexual development protein [Microdochium trichocladiopsis]KAH7021499.1 late sexual development protein [Microdochium trichocladiopsis]